MSEVRERQQNDFTKGAVEKKSKSGGRGGGAERCCLTVQGGGSLEEKQPESLTFQPRRHTVSDDHIIETITVSMRNSAPIVPSLRDRQTWVM